MAGQLFVTVCLLGIVVSEMAVNIKIITIVLVKVQLESDAYSLF